MSLVTEHPTGEPEHPIYRTSPERTVKMMLIMMGIVIAGGAVFFGMWDYWISVPSVASGLGSTEEVAQAVATGKTIPISLSFVESSDFRTLAFNALPGEEGNNPDIQADVGDKIVFDVVNDGKSFHSFGVTRADEGFAGIVPGSDIASASSPLKPGEGGESEFVPSEEGIYYYICTVPGHREQGMVGQIIVGNVSVDEAAPIPEPEPEPVTESATMTTDVEIVPQMVDMPPGTVSIPAGSGVPGCDDTNQCYIPYEVTVSVGDTVSWSNDDTAAHTVTSGNLADGGPDGAFDSSLFMAGTTFTHTFDDAGEYPYFCIVHPWMQGIVTVN